MRERIRAMRVKQITLADAMTRVISGEKVFAINHGLNCTDFESAENLTIANLRKADAFIILDTEQEFLPFPTEAVKKPSEGKAYDFVSSESRKTVVRAVDEFCDKHNMSVAKLCQGARVDEATYSNFKRGYTERMRDENLRALQDFMNEYKGKTE